MESRPRIISSTGASVFAACQFIYKGYEVSFSTVLHPKKVAVFAPADFHEMLGVFSDIEEAIEFINQRS